MTDDRAIGVFDSGLGGLTVLKSLMKSLPNENFVYLGDTARLPYGTKSAETILRYTEQNLELLKSYNVKALVIACNSASAQYSESQFEELPVFNVIDPGTKAALLKTANRKIGLLGTKATVRSRAYEKALRRHIQDQACELYSVPAPLLVPLAEEGWDSDPLTNLVVFRYVKPLLDEGVDTIILGCTHYPILREAIQKATGPEVTLVDSGEVLSQQIVDFFEQERLGKSLHRNRIELLCSDDAESFEQFARKILGAQKFTSVTKV